MKVEPKYYIGGKEVVLVVEACSTRIYQDIANTDQFYITSCDDVIAAINIMDTTINIEEKYQKRELL